MTLGGQAWALPDRDRRLLARRRRLRGGVQVPRSLVARAAPPRVRRADRRHHLRIRRGARLRRRREHQVLRHRPDVRRGHRRARVRQRPRAHVLRGHLGVRPRTPARVAKSRACWRSSRWPPLPTGRSTPCSRPTECSSRRRSSCSALAFGFVAMLRSALRYGAVARAGRAPTARPSPSRSPRASSRRAYFRVGSPGAFYACAAGLIVCAFAITVARRRATSSCTTASASSSCRSPRRCSRSSASRPTAPRRPSRSTSRSTRRASRSAGAARPGATIVSMRVEVTGTRAYVVLHTTESAVRLGPASLETAHAIAAAIRAVHPSRDRRLRTTTTAIAIRLACQASGEAQSIETSSISKTRPALAGIVGGLPLAP